MPTGVWPRHRCSAEARPPCVLSRYGDGVFHPLLPLSGDPATFSFPVHSPSPALSLTVKAQLKHFARVASPTSVLPPTHPTRRLHAASIRRVTKKADLRPWTALFPAAALTQSVYLAACVIPRLLHEPSLGGRLDPATHASLLPVPCPSYRLGVEYWQHLGNDRRDWAMQHYQGADLQAAIRCSLRAARHLDGPVISQLAAYHSHAEWTATHAPANPPPGYVLAPHATSAPLTLCLPSPAPSPSSPATPPTPTASRCAEPAWPWAGPAPAPSACASPRRRRPQASAPTAPAAPNPGRPSTSPFPTCCSHAPAMQPSAHT